MKRNLYFILGAMAVLSMIVAFPVQASEKTGFVDIGEVLVKSEAGKKAEDQFKKIIEKDRASIQDKETELKKLKDELEKQRPLLKEDVYKTKETDYQKKFRDYQLLVKDANEELQSKRQDILKNMVPEIMKIVSAIGEKERYSMIVDISTIPLAYHAKENDITRRVIEEFNKTYKKKK